MTGTHEQTIRELLRPTHDDEGWLERVRRLDPDSAIPLLARVLTAEDSSVGDRRAAMLILGLLRDRRTIVPLRQALDAPDHAVRGSALLALGALGPLDELMFAQVMDALGDDHDFVRESAARALGSLGRRDALPDLAQAAQSDAAENVREAARQAIEAIEGRP